MGGRGRRTPLEAVGPGVVGIGPLLIFGNAHRGLDDQEKVVQDGCNKSQREKEKRQEKKI
jgi:hypothetical protein